MHRRLVRGGDDFSNGGDRPFLMRRCWQPQWWGMRRGPAVVISSLRLCRWHMMALASMADGEMVRRAASVARNLLGTLWLMQSARVVVMEPWWRSFSAGWRCGEGGSRGTLVTILLRWMEVLLHLCWKGTHFCFRVVMITGSPLRSFG
jgi:hypothetical protein